MSETLRRYRELHPAGAASVQQPSVRPPVEAVAKVADEVATLVVREREARDAVKAAEEQLATSRELDLKASATALRQGKREPAAGKTEKAQAALEKAKRHSERVERAAADAHEELLRLIAEHRGELRSKLETEAREALADAREAIELAFAREQRRCQLLRTLSWADDPHRQGVLPRTQLREALNSSLSYAAEAAKPVEPVVQRPTEWQAQRKFGMRVREITAELVAGGTKPAQAHQQATDQARAELETDEQREARRRTIQVGAFANVHPPEKVA